MFGISMSPMLHTEPDGTANGFVNIDPIDLDRAADGFVSRAPSAY